MRIIGLTGGISCGKSTVAELLRNWGYPVIDADQIARDIVAPGEPALEQIRVHFGEDIVNAQGLLDRRALGRIVFADATARQALEKFTHPAIFRRTQEVMSTFRTQLKRDDLIFYENALLYETGSDTMCDQVLVVTASESVQKQRLRSRDPDLSEQECNERIASQWPTDEKAARADHVIENNGSIALLEESVEQCVQSLKESTDG